MGGLLVVGIIWLVYHLMKEACEPAITAHIGTIII